MDPSAAHWSEILKNVVESLALAAGALGIVGWIYSRRDRSAEVLFKLEEQFAGDALKLGRRLLEEDDEYATVNGRLAEEAGLPTKTRATRGGQIQHKLEAVDALLRFYVLVCGLHASRQVGTKALRACYRYWLTQYYNPKRSELRCYVDAFYPTLRRWIARDRWFWTRRRLDRFFTPRDFGWPDRLPDQRRPSPRE